MIRRPPRPPLFPYTPPSRSTREIFRASCPPLVHAWWESLGGRIGAFTYGAMTAPGLEAALAEGHVFTIGGFCSLAEGVRLLDRKSTRLNSSHANISYAVFCL